MGAEEHPDSNSHSCKYVFQPFQYFYQLLRNKEGRRLKAATASLQQSALWSWVTSVSLLRWQCSERQSGQGLLLKMWSIYQDFTIAASKRLLTCSDLHWVTSMFFCIYKIDPFKPLLLNATNKKCKMKNVQSSSFSTGCIHGYLFMSVFVLLFYFCKNYWCKKDTAIVCSVNQGWVKKRNLII